MKLFLLTVSYPGPGEFFLNYELPYLSAVFDEVIICPQKAVENFQPEYLAIISSFSNVVVSENNKISLNLNLEWRLLANFFSELSKLKSFRAIPKLLYRFISCLRVRSFLLSKSVPDAVYYSYWLNSNAMAIAIPYFSKRFCRAHGSDIYNDNVKTGNNPFQKYVSESVTILPISNSGADYLKTKLPKTALVGDVRYLGVNTVDEFSKLSRNKVVRIVFIGQLDKNKGVIQIVNALHKCTEFDFHLTIVGDGPLRDKLKNLIKEKALDDLISMLGNIEHSKVFDFLRKGDFDYIINYSLSEGIPVSLMESMVHGIVPIASDVGGTGELVNGVNGYLIPAGLSTDCLSSTLMQIFRDTDDVYLSMSKAAHKTVLNFFDAKTNFESFGEFIKND